MTVSTLLVKSYATNVYLTGSNSLTNIGATRPEYVVPVMQRAADAYYIDYIDDAKTKGWITDQEHADTLALKDESDPKYSPPITLMSVTETSVK